MDAAFFIAPTANIRLWILGSRKANDEPGPSARAIALCFDPAVVVFDDGVSD
jgi:hypothetical protein